MSEFSLFFIVVYCISKFSQWIHTISIIRKTCFVVVYLFVICVFFCFVLFWFGLRAQFGARAPHASSPILGDSLPKLRLIIGIK